MEFGELLKQLRQAAGWKQDYLARQVGRDVRTIRSWENEGRLPPQAQARALAAAFALTGVEYASFMAVWQGRDPDEAQSAIPAAAKTLPRDIDSFTGRKTELEQLAKAVAGALDSGGVLGICVIRGMPGVGKTSLAVHFAHAVAGDFPGGQFHVELYGHSAQHRPVDPKDVLGALLLKAGVARPQIPDELEPRAAAWRDWAAGRKILLVLDDARDAEQVRPLLPGTAGNLVLITTRQWLAGLPDATDVPLEPMPDDDAACLFAAVARRPGIDADSPGVTDLHAIFHGLPIVITAMAAQLKQHRTWWPSDLRDSIRGEGGPLGVRVSDSDTVRDVLSLSYRNLSAPLGQLFRCLALHPGPDIDADSAAALVGGDPRSTRGHLNDLFAYHLIEEVRPGQFKFHVLIGGYALERAAEDTPADREAAERRLLAYYLRAARTAASFLPRRYSVPAPGDGEAAHAHPSGLSTRDDAVFWLDANRDRLDAAAQYAATHGYPKFTTLIPAFMHEYLVERGHWDQAINLHLLALQTAGDGDLSGRARALFGLGSMRYLKNDPAGTTELLQAALSLFGELGDALGQAYSLQRLGSTSMSTGDYTETARAWERAIGLFRQAQDRRGEADMLFHLGALQQEIGEIAAAFGSQSAARQVFRELDDASGQADALGFLGDIHRMRGNFDQAIRDLTTAIALYGDNTWKVAGARYFLGVVLRETGRFAEARKELNAALKVFREMNDKFDEAGVLNQVGLLQAALGQHAKAAESLGRALELYDEYGSLSGTLEVSNSLGELALLTGDPAGAERYHRRALDIAVDQHVLHEEARAREGIGHALRAQAAEFYRAACVLYERLESPSAARLKEQGLA